MSQFRSFNLWYTGAGSGVYAVWEVRGTDLATGTFIVNETVQWTGGSGKFVSVDNGLFRFVHTFGTYLTAGLTVTGVTSSGTFSVTLVPSTNEEGFDINPAGFTASSQGTVSIGDFVYVNTPAFASSYLVVTSVNDYSLGVTVTGGGDLNAITDVAGFVTRDFTPNLSLPLPSSGDAKVANQVATAFAILDTEINAGAWQNVATHAATGFGTNWSEIAQDPVRWRGERNGVLAIFGTVRYSVILPASDSYALTGVPSVFQLPSGARPKYPVIFPIADIGEHNTGSNGPSVVMARFDTNGTIWIWNQLPVGIPANGVFNFNGIRFRI